MQNSIKTNSRELAISKVALNRIPIDRSFERFATARVKSIEMDPILTRDGGLGRFRPALSAARKISIKMTQHLGHPTSGHVKTG